MKKEILEWVLIILGAIIFAYSIKYFVGTPTIVQQESMKPTLIEGQRLILSRWIRTTHQTPKRGEIITFEAPTSFYTSLEADQSNPIAKYEHEPMGIFKKLSFYVLEWGKDSYIKRVIALPGEHVQIREGKVYINEEELKEDYLPQNTITNSGVFNDFTVPEGYIFVMGDNRAGSADSRVLGCIPLERIESKVWIRIWPFSLFGKVE